MSIATDTLSRAWQKVTGLVAVSRYVPGVVATAARSLDVPAAMAPSRVVQTYSYDSLALVADRITIGAAQVIVRASPALTTGTPGSSMTTVSTAWHPLLKSSTRSWNRPTVSVAAAASPPASTVPSPRLVHV